MKVMLNWKTRYRIPIENFPLSWKDVCIINQNYLISGKKVPLSEPTGSPKDETERESQSEKVELEPLRISADLSVEQELEAQIIKSLDDEVVQARIRGLLQDIMKKELSKMSTVLREAIRNWIFKEKQKYNLAPQSPQPQALADKLEKVETDYQRLENENKKLRREMELKEHENRIMLSAIKKGRPERN